MAKKGSKGKAKKTGKKKARNSKPSEPVIVPEEVLEGFAEGGVGMGTELLELGMGQDIARIRTARTPAQCAAAGGIVRRPPPWSRLPFVCAKPPTRLGLAGFDGAAAGLGAFVSKKDKCAKGYKKVKTVHPFWGTGEFYMCVRPSTVPAITPGPPPSVPPGLRQPVPPRFRVAGAVQLLPEDISMPMLLIGDMLGIGLATGLPRGIAAFVKAEKKPVVIGVTKIALGGAGAALYFLTKKSLPLGIALGTVPSAVEAVTGFIVGAVEKAAEKKEKEKAPVTAALPAGGQLTPEDIRELAEVEEFLRPPLGQRPEVVEEEPIITL